MLKSTTTIEKNKTEEATIISKLFKIEGKVKSSGNILVEGEIQGDVLSESNVVVREKGLVNGKLNANSINIGGKVSGTTKLKEKLTLGTKGNLKGDIFAKILVVEEGAKN
jgi:cytoskeletal protein CcmA (bactofilin family)